MTEEPSNPTTQPPAGEQFTQSSPTVSAPIPQDSSPATVHHNIIERLENLSEEAYHELMTVLGKLEARL